jgi:hypothetical protein
MTLDGVTYSASSICTCGSGVVAGASSTVGQDGSTTWGCAVASTPVPVSTEKPVPTPTWSIVVEVGSKNVGFASKITLNVFLIDGPVHGGRLRL